MRVKTRTAAAVLSATLAATLAAVLGATGAAQAAPAQVAPARVDQPTAKVADAGATVRTAATDASEDEGAGCSRSRKRLWIEGEGWIVRRVTICH